MGYTILVEKKVNFGNEALYIKNEPFRSAFAQLTGKKTLTPDDIEALKTLGYTVCEPEQRAFIY